MARFLAAVFVVLSAFPLLAQSGEDQSSFTIGGDTFAAGKTVVHSAAGTDDLFMAGETVKLLQPVTGSVHAMARRVSIDGTVGGDIYAGGMEVDLARGTRGDATLMGYEVIVNGPVAGDLRATGATVRLDAPVGGYAILSGETVNLNAAVAGDVSLQAGSVAFGPDARIDGKLILYENEDESLEVPASVIAADRIERREMSDWEGVDGRSMARQSWQQVVRKFLVGVLIVAAIAGLIAAVAPEHLARMRNRLLDAPFRTLWLGFLTQSVLIGSAILFAMTVIGIFVAPASIVIALVAGFFGYVIGAYALGVGLILLIGRSEPDGLAERMVAAFIGALVAGVIGVIPLLGWIFVLALTLAGVGAISVRLFRPAFLVAE